MQNTTRIEIENNLRHNYIVNVLDGVFFGFGLGFASFSTVIPLFISNFTNSAIIIGLIPAIHSMGWQLPQLLTARRIARLERYKPFVMFMTIHERIPFLGLALIAWLSPSLDNGFVIFLLFLLLIWQALGGGFTANAWQNMLNRIIPGEILATFLGVQASAANLVSSLGAFLAGLILNLVIFPFNFSLCFFLAFICLMLSFFSLNMTREPARIIQTGSFLTETLWGNVKTILQRDRSFRWFLLVRVLSQFGMMGFSFYAVYAVHFLGMNALEAGIMTSVLLISMTVANPLLGWLADRWSRKWTMAIGSLSSVVSCVIAWSASSSGWFILAVIFAGIANTAFWTIAMALTLAFGTEEERPTYVGMSNSLIAPITILAPILGGWFADLAGYKTTFGISALAGIITTIVLVVFIKDFKTK
jgi:MFS family permease